MATKNEIWVNTGRNLEQLDLFGDTELLPTFCVNARDKPDTIETSYNPDAAIPATSKNARLLSFAASAQPTLGQPYRTMQAILTSGGVEIMPNALLSIVGYAGGQYKIKLEGGNTSFLDAVGEKRLSDLNFSRFDHIWNPDNILAGLTYTHWQNFGWGYEVLERGKPIDLQNLDPYLLYPSCSANLVLSQVLSEAGFTADSLLGEPLYAELNVSTANPFTYPDEFRASRKLQAGFFYNPVYSPTTGDGSTSARRHVGIGHEGEFGEERLNFSYTAPSPYHLPGLPSAATYFGGLYHVDTLGFYDLSAAVPVRYGCRFEFPGQVSCLVFFKVNGQRVFDETGKFIGEDHNRITDRGDGGGYITRVFAPKLTRYLLHPGDTVELCWQGDEFDSYDISPSDPYWQIGPVQNTTSTPLAGGLALLNGAEFSVTMLGEFPPGGLVKLQEWLPDMTQLEYIKNITLLLGLTITADAYEPHLRLAPGNKLLYNTAVNWTAKRDAFAVSSKLPERDLSFAFGEYARLNKLLWQPDDSVTAGYGDGSISIANENLAIEYEMATLVFAASESSPQTTGVLRILNFEGQDLAATPPTYSVVQAKPRVVLRNAERVLSGQLIMVPATPTAPATLAAFTTTASYFTSPALSLELNRTVLTEYWQDLRSMLDETRFIREKFRLTAVDILALDYSRPVWLGDYGDYFCISKVSEFSPARSTTVELCRINAKYLPPPIVPGTGQEFWPSEWWPGEWF